MKKKLKDLVRKRDKIQDKIEKELDDLTEDECNCNKQEEIFIIKYNIDEYVVYTRCGNCGGIILNRTI